MTYAIVRASTGRASACSVLVFILALWGSVANAGIIGASFTGTIQRFEIEARWWTPLADIGVHGLNSLAWTGAFLVSNSHWSDELILIDPSDFSVAARGPLDIPGLAGGVRSLAFSPHGVLFGATNFDGGLYSIDALSRSSQRIGTIGFGVQAMDFSPDGLLFGWKAGVGLIRIDPTNGSAEPVDPVPQGSPIMQTIAFLPDGRLLGFSQPTGGPPEFVYEINAETGQFFSIGNLGRSGTRGAVFLTDEPSRLTAFALTLASVFILGVRRALRPAGRAA